MAKLSKKIQQIRENVKPNHYYNAHEAIELLKKFASKNFRESIDISVNLGVDPRKSDQVVRTSTNLPKGTGKTVRVAVFAQGDNAIKAKNAGADIVGFEDLAEKVKAGEMDFDVVIATPDAMRIVGQLGQILGPRGLMPNPKVGTVTTNVEAAVSDAKSGQVRYRTDKNGIIHCTVGKLDFSADDIIENISALIVDLKKAKPASSKGVYLKKITLSSTMGPGLPIDIASLPV
ncbi:50S ribosomal protein L1 [Legionella quinlivanii]|uniref:Large ribosomal subunit protein uL1 n=1 Tax=Legionella quinlivanii TaxID=45073 RepID=A0A0W0XTD4_9GAMM|nr:50S ribosomal protein L1 [Legionella quinlivanii]KTD48109.1 50S ribosomal protein L1 [Legionella quinlivanii]MCW8452031.1 50S ribosomal protein L1 [Legionella quinlivanii]SEG48918.1 large subunit ribosomal protein L1 [Legionella quinlivanii DSM 21216]STY09772.1 50S ribosomal protein L1 [Legionella quinlivanii]